jgi:hypothetical protein
VHVKLSTIFSRGNAWTVWHVQRIFRQTIHIWQKFSNKNAQFVISCPIRTKFADLLFITSESCRSKTNLNIQGVSEIFVLILTGNRTRQKEQLFYLIRLFLWSSHSCLPRLWNSSVGDIRESTTKIIDITLTTHVIIIYKLLFSEKN